MVSPAACAQAQKNKHSERVQKRDASAQLKWSPLLNGNWDRRSEHMGTIRSRAPMSGQSGIVAHEAVAEMENG
jgi:hypothetical protein